MKNLGSEALSGVIEENIAYDEFETFTYSQLSHC
jgi:hypothetical protein